MLFDNADLPCSPNEIRSQWKDCKKCYFWGVRTQVVPYTGPDRAEVLIVGQGPGEVEDQTGELFKGGSGADTRTGLKTLSEIPPSEVGFANAIACFSGGTLRAQFVKNCFPLLEQVISVVHPLLLVALGDVASRRLGLSGKLKDKAGTINTYRDRPVVYCHHPAFYYKQEGKEARTEARQILRDEFSLIGKLYQKVKKEGKGNAQC